MDYKPSLPFKPYHFNFGLEYTRFSWLAIHFVLHPHILLLLSQASIIGTKANFCRRICRRDLATTMKVMTEPVPRTTIATVTAMATAEVTGIPAPEEAPRNGWGFLARSRYQKCLVLWQRPKHPCRKIEKTQSWEKVRIKYYGRERMQRSSQRTHQKQQEVKEGVYWGFSNHNL